eukprot:9473179-Pyramimonas_sp.AAC.1
MGSMWQNEDFWYAVVVKKIPGHLPDSAVVAAVDDADAEDDLNIGQLFSIIRHGDNFENREHESEDAKKNAQ